MRAPIAREPIPATRCSATTTAAPWAMRCETIPFAGSFVAPFVFPSGRACWTFDELALACQDDWTAAVELLRVGALEAFMGGIGRHDLAASAREAARFFAFAPGGEDRLSADRAWTAS